MKATAGYMSIKEQTADAVYYSSSDIRLILIQAGRLKDAGFMCRSIQRTAGLENVVGRQTNKQTQHEKMRWFETPSSP